MDKKVCKYLQKGHTEVIIFIEYRLKVLKKRFGI